jgi:uncharacterized protein YdeI (BOF family)
MMSTLKTLAVASALILGASQFALAQGGMSGSTTNDSAASGGSGTHSSSQKTGSASSNQKVLKNQNGYQK